MLLGRSMLIAGATQTIRWNPADKAANAVLSNNDTQLSSNSGACGARTTKLIPSGKFYAEFADVVAGLSATSCGIGTAAAALTGYVGTDANGYGYLQGTGTVRNNTADVASGGATYTTGDVIGCAVDTTLLRVWFSKNGAWQFGGNPATGTGAVSISAGSYYFMAITSATNSGVWGINVTPRYAPPAGFSLL